MTTRSIFWRLFWKEYRLQRALWIAMAVLTAFVLALVSEFSLNPEERIQWVYRVALAFSALYCLGCGATLFAGEHEAETYEFQRTLPVSGRRVFCGKITFALLSSAALFGAMWFLAEYFNGWILPDTQSQVVLWELFGLFGLEMLLWTALSSLLFRHVLIAAVLGAAAASVSLVIVVEQTSPNFSIDADVAATVPRRALIAALVALLDLWLGMCWFRAQGDRGWRAIFPAVSVEMPTWTTAVANWWRVPQRRMILGRLMWQHWRQSIRILLAIGVVFVPLAIVGPLADLLIILPGPASHHQNIVHGMAYTLAIAVVPLLGACTFLADQRRRSFRFLTERGVSPKCVWLSRQLIALAIPMFLVAVCVLGSIPFSDFSRPFFAWQVAGVFVFVLGYVVLGTAAGQLFSMFLRSGFLAAVFSVLLTSVLCGWCALMTCWGVNWLWSVLPIPLALLLATRLRTPYWLLERNTLRAWLPAALAIVIPTVVILTAVLCYRVYYIPLVDPGFSPEEYTQPATAEEKATLALYRQAIQESTPQKVKGVREPEDAWTNVPITSSAQEIAWADANQKAIELAL
jgi:hypothetical protein